LENKINEKNQNFRSLSLDEMDVFWNEAKQFEHKL
jgi:uncharacterized protein YabN with tetrapyrrole methylase and pyrophosphatase domain